MAPIITSYMRLDASGAKVATADLRQEIVGFDKSMRNAVVAGEILAKVVEQGFSLAINTVRRAAGAITGFFSSSIDEAREAAEVNSNLDISLRRLGTTYAANRDTIEQWADSVGNMAGRDGEEAKAALSQLLNANLSLNEAMNSGRLVADIAAKGHMKQAEAARMLALTYQGSFRGLRQFGILPPDELSKVQQVEFALKRLMEITNGAAAAEQMRSPLALWRNTMDNIREELGTRLLPMFSRVMRPLNEFIVGLRGSETLKAAFEGIANWIERFLTSSIRFLLTLTKSFDPANWGNSLMTITKQVLTLVWDVLLKAGDMIGEHIRKALPRMLGGGSSTSEKVWKYLDEKLYGGMDANQRKAEAQRLRRSIKAGEGNALTDMRDRERIAFLEASAAGKTSLGEGESFSQMIDRHSKSIAESARTMTGPALPGGETFESIMASGRAEILRSQQATMSMQASAAAPRAMLEAQRRERQRRLLEAAEAETGKYGGAAASSIARGRVASITLVNHGSDMMDAEQSI